MPPSSNLLTTSRVLAYSLTSTLAATTVVYNAFRDRPNFYSAMVALGRSNGNVGILLNFGLLVTFMAGRFMQLMFFGNLRRVEVEHLWERTWYSVTDSLFAMTIFRDQFDAGFVILFVALLFVKVFHWLAGDRVELMEQTPSLPRFFHFRMVSILGALFLVDFISILFFIEFLITEKERSGLIIMFASEFMILFCTLNNTLAKYLINCYDLRNEEPWEQKSMWVSTADLITDFCKLLTYLIFFSLIFSYYGLPLNIVRDVWMTGRSFFSRIRDLVRYRAATKNMDQRYPNATPEELGRTDGTCIICREEMVIHGANPTAPNVNLQANPSSTQPQPQPQANARPTTSPPSSSGLNETPKKLPCGHIFHFYCLRSWLERQQSCPTCRRTVLDANGQPVNQPPTAVPGAAAARPAPAATATRTQAAPTGNAGINPTASATQRVGQFARQLETQAQRQRELELEGRGGTSQIGTSAAVPIPNPSPTPTPTVNPNPNAARTSTSATRPAGATTSSLPRTTAQRSTPTAAGTTSSLISAVFADPVSTSSSSARYPSSVAASIASGSRPAQWGSAYGTQNLGQAVPESAPPGYGYHQSYPNRQSQVQHGLPLPTGGFGSSSWTPPRPSSLTSPQVQSNATARASSSPSTARGSSPASQAPTAASTTNSQAPIAPSSNGTTAPPATSTTVPSSTVEEAAQEEPLDPKEAARAAALKRFAASSKVASKSASKLTAAVKGQTSSTKPTSESSPSSSSSKVEEKVETATTAAASGSSSSSTAPGNPQLIPLFDPSIVPDYQSLHESRLPYPLVSPSQAPISTTPRNGFDLSSFSLRSHPANSPSIPSVGNDLPSKESLEESLKALVAVQENVWKAIEEVTRVVSSLPSTSQVQVGSAPVIDRSESATAGSDRDSPKSTSSDWKGKQAAEGINAPSASSSSRSASPPPPSTRSISPTLTPPTRTQNPWSNESALSSGNSTPAIEHSQSALFSSNPMPRSLSPSRQNLSSTSGVVVDELDMTDEQRSQEVNNMLASHKPKRRVSFASRDDTIEPEEKETSEESQQEDIETEAPLVNGHSGADEEEIGNDSSNIVQPEVNGVEDRSDDGTVVNGIGTHDESDDGDEEVVAQDSTPLVNGEEEGEDQEESREDPILDR